MKSLHEKKVHMERDDPVEGPRTFVQLQVDGTISRGALMIMEGTSRLTIISFRSKQIER
jgi:hypothetical protein